MKMLTVVRRRRLLAVVGVFAVGVLLSGCPSATNREKAGGSPKKTETGPAAANRPAAEPEATPKAREMVPARRKVAKKEPPEEKLMQEVAEIAEKPRDLGPPLVDNPDNLKRLVPRQPIWIDLPDKQVVLQGEVCKAGYPLEFFATYSNRSYEAIVAVNVKPSIVHTGLLAVGAEAGHPARFQPEFVPPTGTEVAIEVRWKDAQGKVQSCPAQHWIRNIKTRKELDANWVFAGSLFVTDEATGKQYYQADSGELICLLSLPNAMLDLPMQGYGAIEARSFEAFAEHLPPEGTPVTLVLKPILSAKSAAPAGKEAAPAKHAAAERKAVEAAEPWLALADKGEYAQCWETAAGYLMDQDGRREFIQKIGETRKPQGRVISRQLESKRYTTTLPDAPNGQYVVLQYKTSFEHHKSARETVTTILDKDRKWRVSGYYIR